MTKLYNKLFLFKFEQNQLPKATICNTLMKKGSVFPNIFFFAFVWSLSPFDYPSFLILYSKPFTQIDFISLYFTDLQRTKMCPGKISVSGTFFFNFDEYLILQKKCSVRWMGRKYKLITGTWQVSHGFALKLLTAASVSSNEQYAPGVKWRNVFGINLRF